MKRHTIKRGERFGRLTVLRFARRAGNVYYWHVRCACGKRKEVTRSNLRSGATTSCGCKQRELLSQRGRKHGMAGSATYQCWSAMIQRCRTNLNYVLKGIRVCRRWRNPVNGFQNFLADMGVRPPGGTIERRLNRRGYTPSNCRWATRAEQNRNTSSNVRLTLRGRTLCAADWARELGMSPKTLRLRLYRGWSVKKALTTPLREN